MGAWFLILLSGFVSVHKHTHSYIDNILMDRDSQRIKLNEYNAHCTGWSSCTVASERNESMRFEVYAAGIDCWLMVNKTK